MGVTECKLVGRASGEADVDERNLASYSLSWNITTDSSMAGIAAANAARLVGPNPLPDFWSTYSFLGTTDNTAFLRGLKIKRRGNERSLYHWRVTGSYIPLQPGEVYNAGLGGGFEDPLPWNRPPIWSGDGEVYTKIIEEDKDGNAILNAAGLPFDPGLEREETRCVAVAVKNYRYLADVFDVMVAMSNAVNDDTWQAQDARTVLCKEVRPMSLVTEGTVSFFPVAFRFVIREAGKTWDDRLLEQGFSYLETADDFTTRTEVDGPDPVLLNANGTKIIGDGPGVYAEFRTFREVDFATVLGF